ncbi:MAG: DUF4145 domain-containing protein [Desulfovibrionaceae bacterium]|nr:DUF4145 domain-containing protein [Desulfovibrionaceae bacterium]
MTFYGIGQVPNKKLGTYLTFWQCSNCGHGVCGESNYAAAEEPFDFDDFLGVYPSPTPLEAPDGTPEDVAQAYKTARRNLHSGQDGDYEAACIMARRSVELAVNAAGGQGTNLKDKIDNLETQGIISQAMREWAHEIRDIGNDGAHEPSVTRKDALQAVYFAEMLFTYLYTLPKMMAERRTTP